MNTVSAQEVKRRGVIVLQEAAKHHGSVHIVKNNQPVGVFLSEAEYAALIEHQQRKPKQSLLDWMINKPVTGNKPADAIDAQLQSERAGWD